MNRKIILVVEDDPNIRLGLEDNLELEGYKVLSAPDGVKGLKSALENEIDLLILDIMLPGMNGYEITREIRKLEKETGIEKQVPIIAITANTLDNDREKCIEAGMNEYLSKPFTAEQLIDKISIFI